MDNKTFKLGDLVELKKPHPVAAKRGRLCGRERIYALSARLPASGYDTPKQVRKKHKESYY